MLEFLDYKIFQILDADKFSESLLGDCQKGILVIVLEEQRPEEGIFLKKILDSLHLNLEKDTLLFNAPLQGQLPTVAQLKRFARFDKVLIFGVSPQRLGFSFEYPLYKRLILNDCQYIFAERLSFLEPNKQAKNDIWRQLQRMFGV